MRRGEPTPTSLFSAAERLPAAASHAVHVRGEIVDAYAAHPALAGAARGDEAARAVAQHQRASRQPDAAAGAARLARRREPARVNLPGPGGGGRVALQAERTR